MTLLGISLVLLFTLPLAGTQSCGKSLNKLNYGIAVTQQFAFIHSVVQLCKICLVFLALVCCTAVCTYRAEPLRGAYTRTKNGGLNNFAKEVAAGAHTVSPALAPSSYRILKLAERDTTVSVFVGCTIPSLRRFRRRR